jgi:CheY-like chemotaxis protein
VVRILVVEDDPDVAEWVVHCVSGPGREVRSVDDAVGTRALWSEGYVADLILLDYDLPGLDGVALLAEARGHWPAAAYVFVTVQYAEPVLERIAATGAERVAKPFEAATLRGAVDRALATGGAA